jgi:uncharacterized cupredoxin-like copper-binding protein
VNRVDKTRRAGLVLGLVAVFGGLPACTSGDQTTPAPRTADAGARRTAPVSHLRVGLTEWTVTTSASMVRAGTVRLQVTNAGATQHDLVVSGRRGRWETPGLSPGQRNELAVTAVRGERLRLWCSLPGHEAQGMHATVLVRR